MSVRNILDGTIPLDGYLPEKLTATDIKAERKVQGNQVMADDSLRSNRYVIAGTETGDITKIEKSRIDTNQVYATNLNASVEVMTPVIRLGDIEVLKDDKKQERRYITMTFYDKKGTTTTGYVEVTSILTT